MTSSHDTITEMLRIILKSSDEAVKVLADLLRRSIIQVADIQHSVDTMKTRHSANKAEIAAESCNTFTVMAASCQPRSSTREELVERKRSNEVKESAISNGDKETAGIPLHVPSPTNIDHNGNSSSSNPPKRMRITDTFDDDDDDHSATMALDQPEDTESLVDESLGRKWSVRFKELQAHKAKHGNLHIPAKFAHNPQLGRWVRHQRTLYKKLTNGKPSQLTSKRIDALNSLGFKWAQINQVDWDVRLEELRQYKAKYGDCLVSQYFPDNPQLGVWVSAQRLLYKRFSSGEVCSMNKERIEALNSLGFNWSLLKQVDWDVRLEELRQYKVKYGDCLVSQYFPDNPQLGMWVTTQRKLYKRFCVGEDSSMNEERIEALNSLGFKWSLRK